MHPIKISSIILAAGNSRRFSSLTPKILHKIGNLSIIDHTILASHNILCEFDKINADGKIKTKSEGEVKNESKIIFENEGEIKIVLSERIDPKNIKYANKCKICIQKQPFGTGDAVKSAFYDGCGNSVNNSCIDATAHNVCVDNSTHNVFVGKAPSSHFVFILYADMPLISSETLYKTLEFAIENDLDGAIIGLKMNEEMCEKSDFGRLVQWKFSNLVSKIVEKKDLLESDVVMPYSNCGLLIKYEILEKFLNEITKSKVTGEFYITQIIELAANCNYKIGVFSAPVDELIGINTKDDFILANEIFQNAMRRRAICAGAYLMDPKSVYFSYDTVLENEVTVEPFVVFLENVYISGGRIKSFSVIEGGQIEDSSIGPFARIRPNSKILGGSRIGNFVEIKNANIEKNVKINHLSYVGDVDIKENCNIGAGTIFCNYDGFEKYKSVVMRDVFIGSNSTIISPVVIGKGGMVAAGSVVSDDVLENDLAVGRVEQKNISDGASKFRFKKRGV